MDFLSHLFLPLIAVYVVRRELFDSPWMLGLAGFGLLPDFDKFLGMPGTLHSVLSLGPLCAVILGVEYGLRDELAVTPVIVALVGSHLLLDLIDGGPVPFLFPLVETGVGLRYPANTVFGEGLLGLRFEGSLVRLRTDTPRASNRTYGFIQGAGVASTLLFGLIYLNDQLRGSGRSLRETTSSNTAREREEAPNDEDGRPEH